MNILNYDCKRIILSYLTLGDLICCFKISLLRQEALDEYKSYMSYIPNNKLKRN